MRRALALLPLLLLGTVIGVITDDSGEPRVYTWSGTGDTETPPFDFPGGSVRLCVGVDRPDGRGGPIDVKIVDEATGHGGLGMGITIGTKMVPPERMKAETGVVLECLVPLFDGFRSDLPRGRYVVLVDVSGPSPWEVRLETLSDR